MLNASLSKRSLTTAILTLALLASCGDKQSSAPILPTIEPAQIAEVPATDELGTFESAVSGLSFWSHPINSFESAVIAANSAGGLVMIDFQGNGLDLIEGTFESGVATSYFPKSGGDIDAITLAYDTAAAKMRGFTVTSADKIAFEELTLNGAAIAKPNTTCLIRDGIAQPILLTLGDNDITAYKLEISADDALSLTALFSVKGTAQHCASNDLTGNIFLAAPEGRVMTLDLEAQKISAYATMPEKNIAGIGVVQQQENAAQLAVMTTDRGPLVYIYDLQSRTGLGAFIIRDFAEIEGVRSVSTFTVGAANYGGVYRNGAVAVVEGAESLKLKLAPWTGVGSKLEMNLTPALDIRTLGKPAPALPALDFEIKSPIE